MANQILNRLQEERLNGISGGIYHYTQIALAYNSNRIEGSELTHDQTRYIFETQTIFANSGTVLKTDDIVETLNHFKLFDYMLNTIEQPLSETLIKRFHKILYNGTSKENLAWFNIGKYKRTANTVGNIDTVPPKNVSKAMKELLAEYPKNQQVDILTIIKQHFDFETIHPFQDGNGRIGRMIMFRECLKNDNIPFIIDADHKLFYYRGLQNYADVPGYLNDTCLSAQDWYQLVCKKFKIQTTKIEQIFDDKAINTLSKIRLKKAIRALVVAGK